MNIAFDKPLRVEYSSSLVEGRILVVCFISFQSVPHTLCFILVDWFQWITILHCVVSLPQLRVKTSATYSYQIGDVVPFPLENWKVSFMNIKDWIYEDAIQFLEMNLLSYVLTPDIIETFSNPGHCERVFRFVHGLVRWGMLLWSLKVNCRVALWYINTWPTVVYMCMWDF